MTTTQDPTPDEARALLRSSASAASAVREIAGNRHGQWLACHAAATFLYFTAMGIADDDTEVGIASWAFGLVLAVMFVALLRGARVAKAGFGRRWVTAMVTWGVLYSAGMVVGGFVYPGEPRFWLPAGVVAALPLVIGAWRENRA